MQCSLAVDFTVGPFPVRVQISFWLATLILGISSYLDEPTLIFTWILVVFFCIMLHELGHAVVARMLKLDPVIQLYWMGGLTIPTRYRRLTPWQDILLSLAGPFAGFVLGGIMLVTVFLLPQSTPDIVFEIWFQVLWATIGWGVINLVPMLPLDGGHIMRGIYQWIRHTTDERVPLIISIGVGVLVALAAIYFQEQYFMVYALFFSFNNFMALRNGRGVSF